MGSVAAWARGWRESNFGRGFMVVWVLKVLTHVKSNDRVEILVWVKHMNL